MIKWLALISAFACPLLVSGCHPWFETRWPGEKKPDPNVVITNSAGHIYNPGTPSWVPLIDDCMNVGGTRSECIATLPPEELAKLEAWEAQVGAMRPEQKARRQVLSSSTETRTFGLVQIDLPLGWLVRVEQNSGSGWSDQVTMAHPAGTGSLSLRSLVAPGPVSREQLRNLTNVDTAIALQFEPWGDHQGYHHEFLEGNTYFRQWWLVQDKTIVLFSYQCPSEFKGLETEHINKVIRSLRAANE